MLTREDWDRYYQILERWAPGVEQEQYAYFHLLQQIAKPGIKWLDVGCGYTLVPKWLMGARALEQDLLSRAKLIVGCDQDAVSLAEPSPILRVACDIEEELPFPDETFDLVTANMVVEHLEQPEKTFAGLRRVLKPDGVAVFLTPNLYHWTTVAARLTPHSFHTWLLRKVWGREEKDVFPTRYHCNTARAFRKKLHAAGFAGVEVHMITGRPRMVGFRPVLYVECLLYRLTVHWSSLREVLCVVARSGEACAQTAKTQAHAQVAGASSQSSSEVASRIMVDEPGVLQLAGCR